jgi:hypothetical protein
MAMESVPQRGSVWLAEFRESNISSQAPHATALWYWLRGHQVAAPGRCGIWIKSGHRQAKAYRTAYANLSTNPARETLER